MTKDLFRVSNTNMLAMELPVFVDGRLANMVSRLKSVQLGTQIVYRLLSVSERLLGTFWLLNVANMDTTQHKDIGLPIILQIPLNIPKRGNQKTL